MNILQSVIVALITGVCSVIAVVISNNKTATLIEYRIDKLEEKTDKHNSVIERVYGLERDVKDIKDELAKR